MARSARPTCGRRVVMASEYSPARARSTPKTVRGRRSRDTRAPALHLVFLSVHQSLRARLTFYGQGGRSHRASKRIRHGREKSPPRSEEHTSELQSRENVVCRLLLEKKHRGLRRSPRPAIERPSVRALLQ